MDNKPIIICTKGHRYNLKNSQDEMSAYYRWLGSKQCPMCTNYDRLSGHSYCNAKMKDIEDIIETEYEKMFTRYLHGNHHWFSNGYKRVEAPTGKERAKEKIRELLMNGHYGIKGAYTATSVRGFHSHYILYK